MILIMGSARSGTSWLGKIFDSHPEVVYRHEPDIAEPCYTFPFIVETEEIPAYTREAEAYLQRLCDERSIRSVGRRPYFPKSYRGHAAMWSRMGIISAVKGLSRLPVVGSGASHLGTPDFVSRETKANLRYVIKSVVSLGRAGLYLDRLTDGHVVHIVRHPCGFVASQLRGQALGKLAHETPVEAMCNSNIGRLYGLAPARLKALTLEEQLAWVWVIFNEKAYAELEHAPSAIMVKHEDLCVNPIEETRRLFDFCGLPWSEQTGRFLAEGAESDREPAYYDVRRNPAREVDKWKDELSLDVIDRVRSVLVSTRIGQLYEHTQPAESAASGVVGS